MFVLKVQFQVTPLKIATELKKLQQPDAKVLYIMWRAMMDVFWNEHVWLPPNTTWEDVAPSPVKPIAYADHRVLVYSIPLALMLIILRLVLDKYVYVPFGILVGVKNVIRKRTPHNPSLEAAYQTSTKIEYKKITALSKQLDMTERQVERWWRLRRSQDKPSNMVKFCENMWLLTIYLYNVLFGLIVLRNKEWLFDLDYCYIGSPHQGLTNDVMYYYMISIGIYWGLSISLIWDVRRKDFWQTVLHHSITLMLLHTSWVTNLYRFGTLVLLITDLADLFLNAAKAATYSRYSWLSDVLFAQFVVVWIVTRLIVLPFYYLPKSWYGPSLVPLFPAYYFIAGLLHLIMVFYIMWTWYLLKVIYRKLIVGCLKDVRSSNSEEISDHGCNNNVSNGNHCKK